MDRTVHASRKIDAQQRYDRLHGPMPERHAVPADDRWIYQPLRAGDLAGLILGMRQCVAATLFRHPEEMGALYEVAICQEDPELLDHTTNIAILMALAAVSDRSSDALENLAARLAARGYLLRFPGGAVRTNPDAARLFSPGQLAPESLRDWKAAIAAVPTRNC
ncbi:hypothetical protein NJL88_05480 [Streptomyces sp. DK15]|uniref:hypothetical protein n=1 Tax=Streptomyces sp. DK15 TaxID=2957499 RepID=UPI0029AA7ECB|nr:hypothetical protein [Streptomyces sp. DK15]MDX2389521.1 hypothetical protein [Streptomyces sp. DK15]